MSEISQNTQAILLLTAPLIIGRGSASTDLLSPGEYKRLARHLRDLLRQPADLLLPDAADLLRECRLVIDESRLQRLLGRGFLLSQAIERWQSRAIWVVSRADTDYPKRLKARLREDAPAMLYGCGDIGLLNTGGLAVVGSRNVNDSLIDYTITVGNLVAAAGKTLSSGGAKGIDQAAMRGALEADGKVIGVLADSLERSVMDRENRNMLVGGQLLLISPYDPCAGFNVGNAMQRNKVIYASADAALVVSADLNKGGTWAGATEQLEKFRIIPVYVRSTGDISEGIKALCKMGAVPWPNPQDASALETVFDRMTPAPADTMRFGLAEAPNSVAPVPDEAPTMTSGSSSVREAAREEVPHPDDLREGRRNVDTGGAQRKSAREPQAESGKIAASPQAGVSPAAVLFATVRQVLQPLLTAPMKDAEVAAALEVSQAQAKAWLQRLVEEGTLEKKKKPGGYVSKQSRLFD
jgi:predicted Rossmann fold nucleotide-binding protein DprA/Smf involved in DNA uptake